MLLYLLSCKGPKEKRDMMLNFFFQWFSRVSSVLITAIVAIPWFIIPCALLMVLFLALRFYYIKTSRELKRLEAIGNIKLSTS